MHAPPCGALHHNVVAPQSPGFGPPPQGAGAEPWGGVWRRASTPTGCDKTDVAPSDARHPTPVPRFDPGADRAVFCGRPHFVQPRWGCRRRIVAAPGFGPPPQGVGPNPGDACGAEYAPRRGATRPTWPHPNASPHARPPFRPRGESGRVLWETAFCSTPLGLPAPNRRRPRVRLPGPRGRGAAPWALECHHFVVKRCTRCVLDGGRVVVRTRQRWVLAGGHVAMLTRTLVDTRAAGQACHVLRGIPCRRARLDGQLID